MIDQVTPLILGGVPIDAACGPLRQGYSSLGGSALLTMANGAAYKQTHWKRQQITTSGSGYQLPALELLDYGKPLDMWCIAPLTAGGPGRQYTLPPAARRRPDVEPWAEAWVRGNRVAVSVTLAGDEAEVEELDGANFYRVLWLPRFSVYTNGISSEFDESTGLHDWSFEARER